MSIITVDFTGDIGAVKPMHAVNNGPVHKWAADQRISNLESYKAAGIPYARTHDAAFYSSYGGEHIIDVNFIFTDFDADPYDPASYDFALTDEYLRVIDAANTKTYYRLGSKIEHWSKKYNTLPPKDFKKWAVICEHIIRHYTEGWANGFHYDIEYWEIWNEPDLDPDDSTHKRCWGGTKKQFFELYHIAATHLKERFPHLKIGGPALAHNFEWAEEFLSQLKAPLDFFSWHAYTNDPHSIENRIFTARKLLDKYGFTDTESILNEWNYVKGWTGDDWVYSLKQEKSLKGAAFIAACMILSQYAPLDMLMYYDARPCGMNGMYCTDIPSERLKGYYPFYIFNRLYEQKTAVQAASDDEKVYALAAKGEKDFLMLTYFDDNDSASEKEVAVQMNNVNGANGVKISYFVLDEKNDCTLVKEEIFTAKEFTAYVKMPLFSTYLLQIERL